MIRLYIARVEVNIGEEKTNVFIERAFRGDELDEASRGKESFKTIVSGDIGSLYPEDSLQELEKTLNRLEKLEHCMLSSGPRNIKEILDDRKGIRTTTFLIMTREEEKPPYSKKPPR